MVVSLLKESSGGGRRGMMGSQRTVSFSKDERMLTKARNAHELLSSFFVFLPKQKSSKDTFPSSWHHYITIIDITEYLTWTQVWLEVWSDKTLSDFWFTFTIACIIYIFMGLRRFVLFLHLATVMIESVISCVAS